MKKHIFSLMFIFSCLLFVSSCSDLYTQADEEDEAVSLAQLATCELDTEAFSSILDKNIKGDILCLGDKLNLFMDIVDTDRPGYVSKEVLKQFMLTGPMVIEPKVVDIVDSIFDLSFLIIAGQTAYIKRSDVGVLLDFLVYFNEHVRKVYGYFSSPDTVSYWRHIKERETVFSEMALIANRFRKIYKRERSSVDTISIENFAVNFLKDDPVLLGKVRSLIFMKKVFLGGEVHELNHVEFDSLLDKLASITEVAFDIYKAKNIGFDNTQRSLIRVFQNDISLLRKLVFETKESENPSFTIYDIMKALDALVPDSLPVELAKFPREIMKVKEIFVGTNNEYFTGADLSKLFDHVDEVLGEAHFFYRVYDAYKDILNGPKLITTDFANFPVYNSTEQKYLDHFTKIAQNYKFVKGSSYSPYFTHEYNRNPNAFFEISSVEYLVTQVFKTYGRENKNARGGWDINLDMTVKLIDDFKWFLRDQGIMVIGRKGGGEIQGVADNFVLMSTLFQYQSNGCESETVCMEVPETSEFLIGLLTALEIKDFFIDEMNKLCASELDQHGRIPPSCFRQNFINVVESQIPGDGKSISHYMPLFYDYLKEITANVPEGEPITSSKKYMKFITETEAFTRSCMYYDEAETDEVYLKSNDAFAVFAGLLNVESSMLRFDRNKNNKLDGVRGFNEVLDAYYKVYQGAIRSMVAPDGGFMAKLAKPIFQYLVKYGKVPKQDGFSNKWKFVKYLLATNKKSDASRASFATILKIIGEQSENGAAHPYKCEECFRDPTVQCEPEGDAWKAK